MHLMVCCDAAAPCSDITCDWALHRVAADLQLRDLPSGFGACVFGNWRASS